MTKPEEEKDKIDRQAVISPNFNEPNDPTSRIEEIIEGNNNGEPEPKP